MTTFRMCQWFVMCGNEATRTRHHPILGDVPICERCDDKIDAIEADEYKEEANRPLTADDANKMFAAKDEARAMEDTE